VWLLERAHRIEDFSKEAHMNKPVPPSGPAKEQPKPAAPRTATAPAPKGAAPAEPKQPMPQVSRPKATEPPPASPAQIALRAYQIWIQGGQQAGTDLANWFEAERQLRNQR
jgi:Protein of unknown function (DUF2934)